MAERGPKMLTDANRRLVYLPTLADYHAPTATELETAVDLSCLITKANFVLGATEDAQINEPEWCSDVNTSAPGSTTYGAEMNFFRFKNAEDDLGWTTFSGKGIGGYLVQRIGQIPDGDKAHEVPFVDADEVQVYQIISGTPMIQAPEAATYEKFRLIFHVQSNVDERAVVAPAPV